MLSKLLLVLCLLSLKLYFMIPQSPSRTRNTFLILRQFPIMVRFISRVGFHLAAIFLGGCLVARGDLGRQAHLAVGPIHVDKFLRRRRNDRRIGGRGLRAGLRRRSYDFRARGARRGPSLDRNPCLVLQGVGLNIFEVFGCLISNRKRRAVGIGLKTVTLRQIGLKIGRGLIAKNVFLPEDFADVDRHVWTRTVLRGTGEILLVLCIGARRRESSSNQGCGNPYQLPSPEILRADPSAITWTQARTRPPVGQRVAARTPP